MELYDPWIYGRLHVSWKRMPSKERLYYLCPKVGARGLEPPQGASGKTGPLRGLWVAHLVFPVRWKRTHLSEAPEGPLRGLWEPFRGSKGPLESGFRDPELLKRISEAPRGPKTSAPLSRAPPLAFRPQAAVDCTQKVDFYNAFCSQSLSTPRFVCIIFWLWPSQKCTKYVPASSNSSYIVENRIL